MRGPGIEPGSQRWQRRILTFILPTLGSIHQKGFIKLYFELILEIFSSYDG